MDAIEDGEVQFADDPLPDEEQFRLLPAPDTVGIDITSRKLIVMKQ